MNRITDEQGNITTVKKRNPGYNQGILKKNPYSLKLQKSKRNGWISWFIQVTKVKWRRGQPRQTHDEGYVYNIIKAVDNKPTAIQLISGVTQGCPLSPFQYSVGNPSWSNKTREFKRYK